MDRTLYQEEHETFRRSFRTFVEREVVPHQERWRDAGMVAVSYTHLTLPTNREV